MIRRRNIGLIVFCATLSTPALSRAQARCASSDDAAATTTWQGPLERRITLRADGISLREALDRIALAANVRFSYSTDAVPVDRTVCVAYRGWPVGAALEQLLHDTELEPRVVGTELIVIAPARRRATEAAGNEATADVVTLEQLLVRGTPETTPNSASSGGTIVIEGRALAQQPSITLAAALNGMVPGLWLWQDAASGVSTSHGSVRGASSFRTSSPTVYIDGIEVANSQLLTRIAPATVERVEIIRGPQGAALYGANALSGVINVITRRDHVEGGSPLRHIHTGFGAAASDFANGATFSQEHALSIAVGANGRSAGVNLAVGTMGEYAPEAGARHVVADAFGRLVRSRSIVTATLRFLGERAGMARSPLIPDSVPALGLSAEQELPATRQFTAGLSARFQPGASWTHSVLLGVDGFNMDEAPAAVSYAGVNSDIVTGAIRATARVSSVRGFVTDESAGTITISAEHSLLRQRGSTLADVASLQHGAASREAARWDGAGSRLDPLPPLSPPAPTSRLAFDQLTSNTGISAQSTLVWNQLVELTAGVRLEQNGSPLEFGPWAVLPMTSSALTIARGPISLKLHAAYGKAIRWPAQPSWATSWQQQQYFRLTQPSEKQSGVEAGVDVRFGEHAALQVTRFNQTATAITQGVPQPAGGHRPLLGVGTIDNRGWEFHASLRRGALSLGGSLALVDSRVTDLAADYRGELRPGDRMLLVPAQTASVSAGWTASNWSISVVAARARDWINYDRLDLLNDLAVSPDGITGDALRNYWRTYRGHTHLTSTVTRQLTQRFLLLLSGSNLLDAQVGEPDNITIVPGRTFSLGIRARF